jgi:hypothetical protein
MEAYEVVQALEPSDEMHLIPDNAEIKIITPTGLKCRVLTSFYKAEENTFYFGADFPEED